jgi:hypothetical protein
MALVTAAAPAFAVAQQTLEDLAPDDGRALRQAAVESIYRITPGDYAGLEAANSARGMQSAFTAQGIPIDPWIATEEAKLTASNAAAMDYFYVTAISGDTAVVGASQADHPSVVDAGSAYVFARSGTTWTEQQILTASDGDAYDQFGASVAISGDTIVVGALGNENGSEVFAGSAYVFVRNGTTWVEQAKLSSSVPVSWGGFGYAVALSGDSVLVGEPLVSLGNSPSPAYVFVRNGTTWTEQQRFFPSELTHYFGLGVALSGDTAVIGSGGSAYVFERNGTVWAEQQELLGSGTTVFDSYGSSVALSGDTAVVGAPGDHLSHLGSAFVFARSGSTWTEQQKLTASDGVGGDTFGVYVALSADTAVIGSAADDHAGGVDAGSAYVFVRSGTSWSEELKLTASDAAPGDYFGGVLALSSDTLLVGAPYQDHVGSNAGSAYVFRVAAAADATYCTAGTSAGGCQAAISASGTPSASKSTGFSLLAAGVAGQKEGIFFFGTNGRQANSWGNGTSLQCVVPPVKRAGLLTGAGTHGACDGAFAQDLNAYWCPTCPAAHKNPGAGATVQAQLWYRDPLSTSNQKTSLSDAIEFGVGL